MEIGRILTLAGLMLLVVGVLLQINPSLPLLGKLPGDLHIERSGFRLHIPVVTSLLLSAVISLALWAFSKLR